MLPLSGFLISLLHRQSSPDVWEIHLTESTSSCWNKAGLGKSIHCLSFSCHDDGDVFHREGFRKTVCECVCVFIHLWLTGRATLHFIYLVCQLLLPMGAGLVEGTKMCFSHVCTSKRTVQIPAPRVRPQIPKLQHWETCISATLDWSALWDTQDCSVLLPSIFSFTQREVCWLIYLRNCLRELKKQKNKK